MPNPDRQGKSEISRSNQTVFNNSFDEVYKVLAVALLGEYNSGLYRLQVDADGNLISTAPSYATRIDEASATVTYIGNSLPGSATSAAAWQIKKIDETSGTVITWASGNANFNKVWDDRASYTYS